MPTADTVMPSWPVGAPITITRQIAEGAKDNVWAALADLDAGWVM